MAVAVIIATAKPIQDRVYVMLDGSSKGSFNYVSSYVYLRLAIVPSSSYLSCDLPNVILRIVLFGKKAGIITRAKTKGLS